MAALLVPACSAPSTVISSVEEWHDIVSDSFVPLLVRSKDPESFHGTLKSQVLDELSVIEVAATGHTVHRTPSLIARSERSYFKLNLQLAGTGILVQDNREATLQPGDLALYDTQRPYTLAFESDSRTLVLMFPHDAIDLPVGLLGRLTATRLASDRGLGLMVSPFMAQLAQNIDVLSGPGGARLARNTVDLLSTMFAAELDRVQGTPGHPQAELLNRIRRFIEANLSDPGLSPASIAAAHYISTRQLHSVFRGAGATVAHWIRTLRLENCRRELRDPLLANCPVSGIAARWGFLDAPHFSRMFQSAFGESPSNYRIAAVSS